MYCSEDDGLYRITSVMMNGSTPEAQVPDRQIIVTRRMNMNAMRLISVKRNLRIFQLFQWRL